MNDTNHYEYSHLLNLINIIAYHTSLPGFVVTVLTLIEALPVKFIAKS